MNIDKETEKQIGELQILEQNLQAILAQKQNFQIELSEIENALGELGKSGKDVYKIFGSIMLKSDKEEITKELKKKQELISLRIKTFESQEKSFSENVEEIRKKVLKKIQK
jgi:prefoldin beta subunit